ncbi:MAG: patatin-like phospholipase family protein [Rhodoferax sp.]
MRALQLYAGPQALAHIAANGLQNADIRAVAAAAGGPKGLVLGALDRFIFGNWLAASSHEIHLVGASIGAWRMATACLDNPAEGFQRLERDYIAQHYELKPGQKRPSAEFVSEQFGQSLRDFYGGRVDEVLRHPRYRLHVLTSRGRHVLGREGAWRTPLGYAGAFFANAVHRRAMGAWLERVVFSSQHAPLPFAPNDYRTRQVLLTAANFMQAVQASCSIPFLLQSVRNIPGAPPGAYWDGGITDYHLHLDFAGAAKSGAMDSIAVNANSIRGNGQFGKIKRVETGARIVLYPHFQKAVVPGWLDKGLKWRHKATHHLDTMLLLAPNPEWVKALPNGKLPDRTDFTRYGNDFAGRAKAWNTAVAASAQMADEFALWLEKPGSLPVLPI